MGIQIRKRVPIRRSTWLTLSKSGVSASHRAGRVTVNSRGGLFVRLLPGVFWRSKL
jgi:hypothetical protein